MEAFRGATRKHAVLWVLALLIACMVPRTATAREPPPATRVLRVKAVADEAFREKKNWEKEIREHLKWCDKEFRKMAGIGLELVAIDRWTTHESKSMSLLLDELRVKVDKGDADIVVGFTGHKPPEIVLRRSSTSPLDPLGSRAPIRIRLPYIAGIALPFGDHVVVRRDKSKKETRHTLLHEITHLFGGLHVKEKSILQTYTDKTYFVLDPFNQRVMALTGGRDFDRDIHELPREFLDQLIALYREAPLRHERDLDTHLRIGYILMAVGEVDAAIDEFELAIDIDPGRTFSLLRGAIIPELEAFAEEHGATPEMRYTLGRAYITIRNWQQAAQHLWPNCFGEPPHAPSCSELGGTLLQAKKVTEAEEILLRALGLDESQVNAHNNLGIVYSVMGRLSDALAHFNRAAELRPDKLSVHYNMGVAYLTLDLLIPAADSFQRVLALDPDHQGARVRLALTLARQGETDEARDLIKPLEKSRRLPGTIVRDMAEIYFLDGDEKKAWKFIGFAKQSGINVTELERQMLARRAKPRKIKTKDLIKQARGYYDRERYGLARQLLEQARAQDDDKAQVHYWLGRVAVEERKPQEARAHFERAIELDDDYPFPHYRLAEMAYDRQDYSTVLGHIGQYLKLDDSPYSRAYYLLGASHFHQDNLPAAEENLKKAIRRRSSYGDAFYLLAAIYTRQERKEEAIAELKLALETDSLHDSLRPEAHYNLAVLCYETGQHDLAWKHARIAERLGYGNVNWLLAELAQVGEEPEE